jgi:hypothetical protein
MSRLLRILAAAALVGVTGFCAFGFVSAAEAQGSVDAVQFLYGVIGAVSLGGAGWLAWPTGPLSLRTLVQLLLTPLLGVSGFAAGILAAGVLGVSLHDNYEYFGPSVSWVGAMLAIGGALSGVATPRLVGAFVGRRCQDSATGSSSATQT